MFLRKNLCLLINFSKHYPFICVYIYAIKYLHKRKNMNACRLRICVLQLHRRIPVPVFILTRQMFVVVAYVSDIQNRICFN